MRSIPPEFGFEIQQQDEELLLLDRRTGWLGHALSVLSLIAGMLAVIGIVVLVGGLDVGSPAVPVTLLMIAAACAVVVAVAIPTYRRRRGLPADDVPDALILDRQRRQFRRRSGDVLAPLDQVTVISRTDWVWTMAMTRRIDLRWPSGKRTVYRSWNRRRVRRAAEVLRAALAP